MIKHCLYLVLLFLVANSGLSAQSTLNIGTAGKLRIGNISNMNIIGNTQIEQAANLEIDAGGKAIFNGTLTSSGDLDFQGNIEFTSLGDQYLDYSVVAQNLVIGAQTRLIVNPGKYLTVNGSLTNNAGNNGIWVKSDASGSGSLIQNTPGIYARVERYLNNADWTNWKDGWHFLSSPVDQQAISPGFTKEPYDLYCWNEEGNNWVNYKNTTVHPTWGEVNGNSLNFLTGKGYLAAYDVESVKEFKGVLNISDVPVTGLVISSGNYRSWHLMGNPYSSALSWDGSADWNLSHMAGVAKIWNEANQSYTDLPSSPSSAIPATNGFMVQVLAGTGSLTIPASKRIHSSQAFFKSAEPCLKLTARNINFGNAQECSVVIEPEATSGFDPMFDSEFLAGYGPQFYSGAGDEKLSTNALPELTAGLIIPVSFIKNDGESYTIEATGIDNANAAPLLTDLKTGITQNLVLNPVYSFTSAEGDDPNRFQLSFKTVGIEETSAGSQLRIWYADHHIQIVSPDSEIQLLEISDLSGRKVYSKSKVSQGSSFINLKLAKAIYIVRICCGQEVITRKIWCE